MTGPPPGVWDVGEANRLARIGYVSQSTPGLKRPMPTMEPPKGRSNGAKTPANASSKANVHNIGAKTPANASSKANVHNIRRMAPANVPTLEKKT